MIQCKIVDHTGVKTIQHTCKKCGKINVRSFGTSITREVYARACWGCTSNQPAMIDLLHNLSDRVQYHRTATFPIVVSGLY